MAGTAADVIAVAESQLGCTDGAKYFNDLGYPDGGAWCVAFVQWCMDRAGVSFPWPPPDKPWKRFTAWDYGDCPWPIDPSDLQPGDAVSFDWDGDTSGDHVGVVKSVHDWGCVTIEGNTSYGVVAERQRTWPTIVCGIRPQYSAKAEWVKSGDRWWYRHADGSYTTDGWERIGGEWYYFDHEGWMVTGWVRYGTNWYYMSEWAEGYAAPLGHMVSGGVYADLTGRCYAFWPDGRMVDQPDVEVHPHDAHDGYYGFLQT